MFQHAAPNAALDTAYQSKQRRRYEQAVMGNLDSAQAYDALWRAASNANLLQPHEVSQEQFTPARIQQLIAQLNWA